MHQLKAFKNYKINISAAWGHGATNNLHKKSRRRFVEAIIVITEC
jgi:hypothetical protein